MRVLIRNCRLIDPANGVDLKRVSVVTENGVVAYIGEAADARDGDFIIEAEGLWAVPGFIDLHVHLREPGQEYKEDIATGTAAALAGGFTTVCAMPNTMPVLDTPELISRVLNTPARAGVLPIGCLTVGQRGERAADIAGMAAAGAIAFSEDGRSVANARVMKEALKLAAAAGRPVFAHCEDAELVNGGVVNEDAAARLGLPGISRDSEDVIIARDIQLARAVGARLHICHISTAGGAQLLREAKARGESVTGEVTPHHFSLTDADVDGDAAFKMNPPLRGSADVAALHAALADGTIDVIATDHAPHSADEKSGGFMTAANGIVGLETAFALGLTNLVARKVLTAGGLIAKLSCNPARIIGLPRGDLAVGKAADIAVIDPAAEWTVDAARFYSKGKSTPFAGKRLAGVVLYTITDGKPAYAKERMLQ